MTVGPLAFEHCLLITACHRCRPVLDLAALLQAVGFLSQARWASHAGCWMPAGCLRPPCPSAPSLQAGVGFRAKSPVRLEKASFCQVMTRLWTSIKPMPFVVTLRNFDVSPRQCQQLGTEIGVDGIWISSRTCSSCEMRSRSRQKP